MRKSLLCMKPCGGKSIERGVKVNEKGNCICTGSSKDKEVFEAYLEKYHIPN